MGSRGGAAFLEGGRQAVAAKTARWPRSGRHRQDPFTVSGAGLLPLGLQRSPSAAASTGEGAFGSTEAKTQQQFPSVSSCPISHRSDAAPFLYRDILAIQDLIFRGRIPNAPSIVPVSGL